MNDLIALDQEQTKDNSLIFKRDVMNDILIELSSKALLEAKELNTDTPKGRKQIASLSRKVSSSKTYVEKLRKDFIKEKKAVIKEIDNIGQLFRESCDQLRDRIREPLTEWEEHEKARIDNIKCRIENIKVLKDKVYNNSDDVNSDLEILIDFNITKDVFGEFTEEALLAKQDSLQVLDLTFNVLVAKEGNTPETDNSKLEQLEEEIKTQNNLSGLQDLTPKAVVDKLSETITIPRDEYLGLYSDSELLTALLSGGVENWQGYDESREAYHLNEKLIKTTVDIMGVDYLDKDEKAEALKLGLIKE